MLDLVEAAETTLFITQESYANRSCAEGTQHMLYEIQKITSL
jgi:hypothetical protein